MGEVIPFKRNGITFEPDQSSAHDDLSGLIDHTELVNFEELDASEALYADIGDIKAPHVHSCFEYLMLVKKYLIREDYEAVVLGIMDPEYYAKLEEELQQIVDTYYYYETV